MQVDPFESIKAFLDPWYRSLENPQRSQQCLLQKLLKWYAKTEYGKDRNVENISSIQEFRQAFPAVTYKDLLPMIEEMKKGHFHLLLPEPPLEWGLTRGTTGESKFIPLTAKDLQERALCAPRGLLNFVLRQQRLSILGGYCLNLNFPSFLGKIKTEKGEAIPYGFSSGIYARHSTKDDRIKIVPDQKEIDELGGGIAKKDWERRFELAYTSGKEKNVTILIGVTQTMIEFGRFLKKKFGKYPKAVWGMELLVCTSIPGIHTKYAPALKGLYGKAAIVEMYGATEGMYAQQLDEKPFVVPNYDVYFFEVETKKGTKPLYELKKGEYGSLIISSLLFPRYRIGDIIKCFGNNYFRILGRDRPLTHLRYLMGRWFGYE